MYRRLKTRGGALDAVPSLHIRAIASHMLKHSNTEGRIPVGHTSEVGFKRLAQMMRGLLGGATTGEMRTLPAIMQSIIESGAWTWEGTELVASRMILAPPKARKSRREKEAKPNELDARLNEPTARLNEKQARLNEKSDNPAESFNNQNPNITEQNRREHNIVKGTRNGEVASWIRAGKIIEGLFIEATGNCWMLTSRHQTDLSQLWAWSEKQAQVKGGDAGGVFRAIARRWIDDDWVKDNGYPLGVLAKAPQKYAVPTSQERKDHEAQLKFLKLKKARLYADGQYEASDKIGEQIRSLSH